MIQIESLKKFNYNLNLTLLFPAASLLNVHGQRALRLLFSRHTHLQFSYNTVLAILPIYFVLACWASGSAVASGIVVPML